MLQLRVSTIIVRSATRLRRCWKHNSETNLVHYPFKALADAKRQKRVNAKGNSVVIRLPMILKNMSILHSCFKCLKTDVQI